MPFVVISGGQTGVDLAALEAAEICGVPYAGWVPLHYTNETGAYGIPERFREHLRETETTASAERTERNIQDADGILTLLRDGTNRSESSPGTQHGLDYAKKLGKTEEQMMFINLDLDEPTLASEVTRVSNWIESKKIQRCAIGGPRESEEPGIQLEAKRFLQKVFTTLQEANYFSIRVLTLRGLSR